MIASILILFFSLVLFIYWFRYTCLLILRTGGEEPYADRVARANHLHFPEVRQSLNSLPLQSSLDPILASLERDYAVLQYLMQHAENLGIGALEQRMLAFDYRLMELWYRLTRRTSAPMARRALAEMSEIVTYFAQEMGKRAASFSEV